MPNDTPAPAAFGTRAALPRVWSLAWPLILSNITVPLLGLVDTAVLGHLPQKQYIGAVALGATLFSFLFWGFGFLRMGVTGLTAQALGRGNHAGVILLLGRSLLLAAMLGLALIALRPLLVPFGLALLDGSPKVTTLAADYAAIRIAAAPAVLANYALIGWFLGLQRSRVTLLLMLINNGVNIVLDLLFVLGLGMAVAGVAAATAIAAYVALFSGLWLALAACRKLRVRPALLQLCDWQAYRQLLSANSTLFVHTLALLFAMAFFNARSAGQGDLILAANTVLFQFILLTSFALDGFAHATESLTGEAVGRRSRQALSAYLRAASWCCLLSACAMSLLFYGAGDLLIALLTDLPEVRHAAAVYLPWLWLMPLAAVWCYLLDGLFIGLMRTRAMRDSVLIAVLLVYLPSWYVTQGWGNHGLWLAFVLFHVARGAGLGWVLLRHPLASALRGTARAS